MISFKGILKVVIYIFIAGWMFLLGIMVGRGTSPVTFDTQQFQKRLEIIANEFGKSRQPDEKVNLKFYEVLDNPPIEESNLTNVTAKDTSQEITPIRQPEIEKIDLKTSKKKETIKKFSKTARVEKTIPIKSTNPVKADLPENAVKTSLQQKKKHNPDPDKKEVQPGKYTIQISAYKDFKDAVSQMAVLEKKGFPSYRTTIKKDGVTWYRVRSGSFLNYEDAEKYKLKLDKANIISMIVKQ